ncbi:UDP-N-acetylmuramoyl-L-alanyl-D-glutamate--2,6-diaminopimelate ligase [Shewanella sp. Scap07]|uniref:UDP-N-acetylmuramoyl-L-alanyl-D-glutamate--2, 6-diaminopimelate ligase n=1 Tax=Shewanella sp. Scap07 TaxID=2589987 RepID=UPI0015BF7A48|nr:UDP-N-acetylmuramoyl-L-alanyl-D-glutamate--2,6-diaminopimelate ligase [Shewanella sp. Scap07]
MMLLSDLLAPWFHYAGRETIKHISIDSRAINSGDLFVAVPGYQVDGRDYIEAAFANGAIAVLQHTDSPDEHGKVSVEDGLRVHFFQLNRQLSALAAQAYPLSSQRLKVIGVTGTNGKTSVTQIIAQLSLAMNAKPAVMGTLGNGLWGELVDSGNTTADAITVMQQLQSFDNQHADLCAMEVSSHGLVQGRIAAVPFDVALFTNLSRDHLDFHGSMQSYADAKQGLFQFNSLQYGAVNLDDATGSSWFDAALNRLHGFSIRADERATIYADNVKPHGRGVSAEIIWPDGRVALNSPLLGDFNLSNLLAAITALYFCGYPMADIIAAVSGLTPVAGRMERFTCANGVTLVVDYAHTPDAIAHALQALRGHCDGQLWCVFGCGGDRDKGKRPLMAKAAESHADKVVVTSDNARSEAPEQIIEDIVAGLAHPKHVITEVDREQAIKQAVAQAKAGDIILLAGKGHETYQEVAGVKRHYDERALAALLAEADS